MLRFRILNEPCKYSRQKYIVIRQDLDLLWLESTYIVHTLRRVKMDAMKVTLCGFCCISQEWFIQQQKIQIA